MRVPFLAGLLVVAALLSGCGQTVADSPSIKGPLTVAPPVTAHADAGEQHAIADLGNAAASGDHKAIVAAKVELAQERKQDPIGSLTPFYALGVLFVAIAALLCYEGNLKLGGAAGVIAAAFIFGPLAVTAIIVYSGLVLTVGMLLGAAFLVYHYRAREKVLVLAVEHAVAHIPLESIASHTVADVERVLHAAWWKAKAEAEALAVKLHLIKAIPAAPSASVSVAK